VSHLRDSATIVYDPNVSACLIDDRANARDRVEDFVALADIVKASDEDVARLYGARADSGDIAAGWLSLGPSLVIVTRGTADTLLYPRSGSPIRIPSQQVDVIDTAGAGDSFFAALIDGLTRISLDGAAHRDNLNDISRTHLQSLGAYASTAASLTASRRGAVPPTREELAAVNGRYRAM
jgi:fructokinase